MPYHNAFFSRMIHEAYFSLQRFAIHMLYDIMSFRMVGKYFYIISFLS